MENSVGSGFHLGALWERDIECGVIAKAIQAATGVLVVEGAAGVGKSRLLAQARAEALQAGVQVAMACGLELEQSFGFGVVRQLFEALLARADGAERDRLWSGAAQQAQDVFTSGAAEGSHGDFSVLHGLFWLTANLTQNRPMVMIVDDLQWSDVSSLRYLAHLLPRIDELGVVLVTAVRTGESASDDRLVQQVVTGPRVRRLRPRPLSATGSRQLLDEALSVPVDPAFARACHEATRGNPLLLWELARTIHAEGMDPRSGNAARIHELAPQAVSRLVGLRMAGLRPATVDLVRAVAVLGDGAELVTAAALAGQDQVVGLRGADELERLEILRARRDHSRWYLSFVHPLVQAAIYSGVSHDDRARAHDRAANLLSAAAGDVEHVAAHLLRTLPAGNAETIGVLRQAAKQAQGRGAPQAAYAYLRRAIDESHSDDLRLSLLIDAGRAALHFDLDVAADHLRQVFDKSDDALLCAEIAALLGTAYNHLRQPERAFAVIGEALARLPGHEHEHRHRLEAALLTTAAWFTPSQSPPVPPHPLGDEPGSLLLGCAIACHAAATRCDPSEMSLVRRAFDDDALLETAGGDMTLALAGVVLIAAGDDITSSLNRWTEAAHRHGSLYALLSAYNLRSLSWLAQGQLAEAEQDARESLHSAQLADVGSSRLFAGAFLAESLAEQGRLDEAESALTDIGVTTTSAPPGPAYFALAALARLQLLRCDYPAALRAARRTQECCETFGLRNPAVVSWRVEAALALRAMDRVDEAYALIADDVASAERWGAARARGRAVHAQALIVGGADGLAMLGQADELLGSCSAQLDHAKVHADLGAALRRANQRVEARRVLQEALRLASRCDANPLVERIRMELLAAGARVRGTALVGPHALTPSERRVAEKAAEGTTNREIAQALFITPKTVEMHLSSAYRKLGITRRADLARTLGEAG